MNIPIRRYDNAVGGINEKIQGLKKVTLYSKGFVRVFVRLYALLTKWVIKGPVKGEPRGRDAGLH